MGKTTYGAAIGGQARMDVGNGPFGVSLTANAMGIGTSPGQVTVQVAAFGLGGKFSYNLESGNLSLTLGASLVLGERTFGARSFGTDFPQHACASAKLVTMWSPAGGFPYAEN